tara:strand:- start:52302 stop:53087 length:786 start_codon:yes stop_codon:yes gene_type:complete
LTDRALVDAALSRDVASIIHLAALPGGAAEADPSLSFDVNVAGSATLMRRAAECLDRPRFVFASSIAVLGNPLPKDGVTDETTPQPTLIYGIHKQMTEAHLDGMTHRGDLDGLAIRLPGIVARPSGNSGLKSAFMSDVFHALNSHRHFVSPVSAEAELWLMSNAQISTCLLHALDLDETRLTGPRVFNLPALHISMKTLVSEIADQTGAAPDLVTYTSDAKLEAAFGRYPPLSARTAERAGFRQDGDVKTLVHNALTHRSV